jgi:hypothetical protein
MFGYIKGIFRSFVIDLWHLLSRDSSSKTILSPLILPFTMRENIAGKYRGNERNS